MVGEGKPGVEIVKLATQERCDVVVISTHGRTGLKRAMLGSVPDYVVHNLEGPAVLLVRPADGGDR
jgi:nucleotide-binding universal stress UspA family protein